MTTLHLPARPRRLRWAGALLVLGAICAAGPAWSAPEDRGIRGWFVGGGGGVATGTAESSDGERVGSFFGGMGRLRVGEEAIPDLYLGLTFLGGSGSADRYDTGFGGLFLEAGWRAFPESLPALVLIGGTGLGGGELTPTDPNDDFEGMPGGAMYEIGLMWEFDFGDAKDGFTLAPTAHLYLVPGQFGNDAGLQTVLIGVESIWYGGR